MNDIKRTPVVVLFSAFDVVCTFSYLVEGVSKCLALRTHATYVGRRSRALGVVYVHLTLLMASSVSWGKEPAPLCLFLAGC